jgi:hypothetical protein
VPLCKNEVRLVGNKKKKPIGKPGPKRPAREHAGPTMKNIALDKGKGKTGTQEAQ